MTRPRATTFALALGSLLVLAAGTTPAADDPADPPQRPAPSRHPRPSERVRPRSRAIRDVRASTPKADEPEVKPPPALDLPGPDSVKPLPLAPIPDDPPPHEGALADVPIVIEPPDLLIVEVLEALPGRPISGERLVRPDGTISLGFYGEVHVRGLTPAQAKEKIALSLRHILGDEPLGLLELDPATGDWRKVGPRDSRTVFVDVSSYNSSVCYVQGDVAAPGRLPLTGHDTVLDALNHAGGLLPTADPGRIRLLRPERGGKPAKEYPVDLVAIRRGEARSNYQLFPGDRILVGRDRAVTASVRSDRKQALLQPLIQSMRQYSALANDLYQVKDKMTASDKDAFLRVLDTCLRQHRTPNRPSPEEDAVLDLVRRMLGLPGPPKP